MSLFALHCGTDFGDFNVYLCGAETVAYVLNVVIECHYCILIHNSFIKRIWYQRNI